MLTIVPFAEQTVAELRQGQPTWKLSCPCGTQSPRLDRSMPCLQHLELEVQKVGPSLGACGFPQRTRERLRERSVDPECPKEGQREMESGDLEGLTEDVGRLSGPQGDLHRSPARSLSQRRLSHLPACTLPFKHQSKGAYLNVPVKSNVVAYTFNPANFKASLVYKERLRPARDKLRPCLKQNKTRTISSSLSASVLLPCLAHELGPGAQAR